MNTENRKTNESSKFCYYFISKLRIKDPNKNIELVNLSIYYTWKTIKFIYKKNKFKRSTPKSNDVFHLPDGSSSESDI